jgi:hypothetical protein
MALPDRDLYPDYYEIIPQPMSFDIVEAKIKAGQYGSEKNFQRDVNGIFANAKYYNEDRSQIWRDAATMEVRPSLAACRPGRCGSHSASLPR